MLFEGLWVARANKTWSFLKNRTRLWNGARQTITYHRVPDQSDDDYQDQEDAWKFFVDLCLKAEIPPLQMLDVWVSRTFVSFSSWKRNTSAVPWKSNYGKVLIFVKATWIGTTLTSLRSSKSSSTCHAIHHLANLSDSENFPSSTSKSSLIWHTMQCSMEYFPSLSSKF